MPTTTDILEITVNGKPITKSLTSEQLKVLQELITPEQYELKEGSYYIHSDGSVNPNIGLYNSSSQFGTQRDTLALAINAKMEMRIFNRLSALRDELMDELMGEVYSPDWDDRNEEKFYIEYDHLEKEYTIEYCEYLQSIGTVYLPKSIANKICKMLNSKTFTL